MVGPNPRPACRLDSFSASCTNGSNTASTRSAGMPMPVSRTSIHTASEFVEGETPIVIDPAGGVNFIALVRRFSRIWCTFSLSARTTSALAIGESRSSYRFGEATQTDKDG